MHASSLASEAMRVRSFEIIDADLRQLHDYLLEVGGFTFRAGGSGFFVLVGEKFYSHSNTQAQMILAQTEADTVSIDVVAAAGGRTAEHAFMQRATGILVGFAERHELEISDL